MNKIHKDPAEKILKMALEGELQNEMKLLWSE